MGSPLLMKTSLDPAEHITTTHSLIFPVRENIREEGRLSTPGNFEGNQSFRIFPVHATLAFGQKQSQLRGYTKEWAMEVQPYWSCWTSQWLLFLLSLVSFWNDQRGLVLVGLDVSVTPVLSGWLIPEGSAE